KAVFAPVSSEESHRNTSSVRATKPAAIAFAAKTFDNKRRYFELDGYVKRNFNASTRPVTSNNFAADVHSNNAATDNRPSNSLVSLSNELLARLMSLLNDNDVYSMVCKCFKVNVMDISNLGLTVGHTNGTQALITKIDDLKINNDITLYDVLVVLECTVSLLSVLKIARDSNLFVVFDETKCYIQDLKANNTVRSGNQCNGLYFFDVYNACKIVSNNCIASCYVSKSLWHQRLGHPVDQVMDVLKHALNFDSQSGSDHLYVWGPYKITSRDGFKYLLTVVDDYSRAVWVYLLKWKDDVYDSIGELPLYLSSKCILTTVYLINRIPSFVLSGKYPYFFMYAHDPSLSHFRVLGCLCYATILNIQDKFSSSVTKDLNNKNFFDNENPKRPNDERRVSSYNDVTELNPNSEDDGNSVAINLPVNVVRRSSRHIKLPTSLNDFIVEGKVKYGIERVVNYTNLNSENFYFAFSLNESIDHTCDKDVILDNNWIDAMNVERSS
ncbi:ribonuclease H-like domain-containing protein, partial [Tanacetum coccineum]